MFTIKTSIRPSEIHGMGVFAEEFVKKNSIIWVFNPTFDLIFSQDQVSKMSTVERELVHHYGYLDTQQFNGWWIFSTGNDRFTNHSYAPNMETLKVDECQYNMIASCDINIGDELTSDYREYEVRIF